MHRNEVCPISQYIFGFDIDGVLTHDDDGETNIWLEEASAFFEEPIVKRAYYVEDAFNKTWAEVQKFFEARIETIFATAPVKDHSAQTLRDLKKRGCTIHLITARDEQHRAVTADWLHRHEIPYHTLSMSPPQQSYSKGELCKTLGVEFFVDDKIENAQDVASRGIYTLLFHASHNLDHKLPLPLVKDWLDVQHHIGLFFAKRLKLAADS